MSESKIRPISFRSRSQRELRIRRIQNSVFTFPATSWPAARVRGKHRARRCARADERRVSIGRSADRAAVAIFVITSLRDCGGAIASCSAAIRCYVRGTKAREWLCAKCTFFSARYRPPGSAVKSRPPRRELSRTPVHSARIIRGARYCFSIARTASESASGRNSPTSKRSTFPIPAASRRRRPPPSRKRRCKRGFTTRDNCACIRDSSSGDREREREREGERENGADSA